MKWEYKKFIHDFRLAAGASDTVRSISGLQSVFHFILKVLKETEVRTLYRPIRFYHDKGG